MKVKHVVGTQADDEEDEEEVEEEEGDVMDE